MGPVNWGPCSWNGYAWIPLRMIAGVPCSHCEFLSSFRSVYNSTLQDSLSSCDCWSNLVHTNHFRIHVLLAQICIYFEFSYVLIVSFQNFSLFEYVRYMGERELLAILQSLLSRISLCGFLLLSCNSFDRALTCRSHLMIWNQWFKLTT
jgi:hypothetical protein